MGSVGFGPQAYIVNAKAGTTAKANHLLGIFMNVDSSVFWAQSWVPPEGWARTFTGGSQSPRMFLRVWMIFSIRSWMSGLHGPGMESGALPGAP